MTRIWSGGGGLSLIQANATYLRLDTSNDPLTGRLQLDQGLEPTNAAADNANNVLGSNSRAFRKIFMALSLTSGPSDLTVPSGNIGIASIDSTHGDMLFGPSVEFQGYYQQLTVKQGTSTSASATHATNLYQGKWGNGANPVWPFLEVNYNSGNGTTGLYTIGGGEDGATYLRRGLTTFGVYASGSGLGGGGIYIGTRLGSNGSGLSIMGDEGNNRVTLRTHSPNEKGVGNLTQIAVAGRRLLSFAGLADPATPTVLITLGTAANPWGAAFIGGDLTHTGTKVGFYGAAVVARPAAYTQTYATATRTHAARTDAALTDNTAGTVSTTLAALPDPADGLLTADALRDDLVANLIPVLRNALASLADQHNKTRTDSQNSAQFANQILDDFQLEGLLQ